MAGTTIAYSEITILDLIDTATYIYYSENENGQGATIAPTANTKYIGIYSGPSVEGGQPNTPPSGTEWSKYVGEDGQKGDKGDKGDSITIASTYIQYAIGENGTIAPSTGWQSSVPTLNGGDYLWTKTVVVYSDGKSTESFSVSYFGQDANAYYIETSQEEILRFYEDKDNISCSPQNLQFTVYSFPRNEDSEPIIIDDYKFQYLSKNGFKEVNEKFLFYDYLEYEQGVEKIIGLVFNVTEFYANLPEDLNEESGSKHIFRFQYYEDNKEKAIKIIESRFGIKSEMAKFNLYADGLVTSIQDSKLEFNANGLTVKNGGIRVYNSYTDNGEKKEEVVLGFDEKTGNLQIKGYIQATGGIFEGTIKAKDGTFSGELKGNSGTIGGFQIENNILKSTESINSNDPSQESKLILDGSQGLIKAENIELGLGAQITDKIIFGERENPKCYLCNPSLYDNLVLKASNIELKNTGVMNLGSIRLDGGTGNQDGYIAHMEVDSNSLHSIGKWAIYENGYAEFQDLKANNVTLQNSVLEIDTIQSAGSLMIFKEAWKIERIVENENDEIELKLKDYESGLEQWDWILIKDNFFQIKEIKDDKSIVFNKVITEGFEISKEEIVIRFGQSGVQEYKQFFGNKFTVNRIYYEESNGKYTQTSDTNPLEGKKYYYLETNSKDYIISILGSNRKTSQDYASPNSLTIADFYIDAKENKKKWNKHLILGNLSSSGKEELKNLGFGLYSDNVYLNGSLTTINQNGISAGINTTHDIYDTNDNSRIVFWAGATQDQEESDKTKALTNSITNAPFRVTEDGSIYANKGIFNGSIITNATIQGSEVYTLHLYGGKKDQSEALQIYGSSIAFFDKETSKDAKAIFTIDETGFFQKEINFIKLTEAIPKFLGNITSGQIEINAESSTISFKNTSANYNILNESNTLKFYQDANPLIEMSNNVTSNVPTYLSSHLWLGNKLHYQPVLTKDKIIGYDLYID